MLEFKIEPDALSERREARGRILSWGIVLLLAALTALIFILGFKGLLGVGSDLHWLGWLLVPASFGAHRCFCFGSSRIHAPRRT